MPETRPYIPTNIVVHLGLPDSNAQNVTVPFREYIYNVASSEIYPTWEESALRANILAIISYALNRIYTEYYPSRGYNFNITSTTQYDQKFIPGRSSATTAMTSSWSWARPSGILTTPTRGHRCVSAPPGPPSWWSSRR